MPDGEIQALLFDFNGTLSDDAPGLLRIYRQITSEMGLPFRETLIPIVMALPDADIFRHLLEAAGLPPDDAVVGRLIERRRDLYARQAASSPPITSQRRQLIRNLASQVPVGVVSGAFSHEIKAVLTAAGLDDVMTAVVGIDHVTRGKPDPEGWLLGLAKINTRAAQPIAPNRVLAIDDSADGLRGARRAGMRTAAVSSGVMPAPQAEADFVLGALDEDAEAILLEAVTAQPQPGRASWPPHAAAGRDRAGLSRSPTPRPSSASWGTSTGSRQPSPKRPPSVCGHNDLLAENMMLVDGRVRPEGAALRDPSGASGKAVNK